jgi:hypothetical protein
VWGYAVLFVIDEVMRERAEIPAIAVRSFKSMPYRR